MRKCRSENAGRGLNPRPERSTHAKAGEQRTENRNQYKRFISGGCFSGFGIAGGYLAGVDHSGRGFNPRPAQRVPVVPKRRLGTTGRGGRWSSFLRWPNPCGDFCQFHPSLAYLLNAPLIFTIIKIIVQPENAGAQALLVPVGGSTPDRLRTGSERGDSARCFPLPREFRLKHEFPLPVGGSTPDRLKDRLKRDRRRTTRGREFRLK